jgi:hypothetical protein
MCGYLAQRTLQTLDNAELRGKLTVRLEKNECNGQNVQLMSEGYGRIDLVSSNQWELWRWSSDYQGSQAPGEVHNRVWGWA